MNVWLEVIHFCFTDFDTLEKNFFLWLQSKGEWKLTPFTRLGFNSDVSLKLSSDLSRNDQTKSNSAWVHPLRFLKEAKELKQLALILFWNSYSRISDRDLQKFLLRNLAYLHDDFNLTLMSKFERIWLKTEQNLHYSLFISNN